MAVKQATKTTARNRTASPPLQPDRTSDASVPAQIKGPTSLIPGSGGVTFMPQSLGEVVNFAKIMSDSGNMVPAQFRGNVGACAAVTFKALHWGLSPFDVASEAYIASKDSREGVIAYGAKLIHAVINIRSKIQEPLEVTYEGEGIERRATVIGILGGKKREYKSPKVRDIKVKNSPLWTADLDQQLHYYSVRAWSRRWCPEVILGAYTREEIEGGDMAITEADRAMAIEHRRDVLDDDPIADDEPLMTAPLGARMSYRLEKCSSKEECMGVYLKFQTDIDALSDEDEKQNLRRLYNVHLKRVKGEMSFDEAMEFSHSFRPEEAA